MLLKLPENEQTIKRRLASVDECKFDLASELQKMFNAFHEAVTLFDNEIIQTPPQSRARALEATLLNSKMMQSIQKHFPQNWSFGKYKRFILNLHGYTILFKKLNSKNKPMNIKTFHSTAITNQHQTSLFDNERKSIDPILIFGYKKDRLGHIFDPKLVYIDENEVRWTINENSVETNDKGTITLSKPTIEKAMPQLKSMLKEKKASNDKE